MVNRSRTAAGACNAVSRSVLLVCPVTVARAIDQRSGLPRRSVAGCPIDVYASIGPRSGGAHVARRPGGAQGPPLAPSPTVATAHRPRRLDEGCAPIACRLVALPSPASRPSTPRRPPSCNPAPVSTRPVDARIGQVRPASARRPASVPPSTRPHTPNRRLGALLWPAQPGSDPFGRR